MKWTILVLALVVLAGCVVAMPDLPEAAPALKPEITIVSVKLGKSTYGRTQGTVHIRNDNSATVAGVKVWVDCYQGTTIGEAEWMPADPYDLAPGAEAVVNVRFAEGVKCDKIRARVTVR